MAKKSNSSNKSVVSKPHGKGGMVKLTATKSTQPGRPGVRIPVVKVKQ
jgi:hypothetical protein